MTKRMPLQRAVADTGMFMPGTAEYEAAFNRSVNDPDLTTGSKFQDGSSIIMEILTITLVILLILLTFKLEDLLDNYSLNSSGTIYKIDYDGEINYSEYGVYTQVQKELDLSSSTELKLTGSVRYDKSEFFDGFFSPRFSAGLTVNKDHNIRASIQTGFRNPTTQDLFIGLDAGRANFRWFWHHQTLTAGQEIMRFLHLVKRLEFLVQ